MITSMPRVAIAVRDFEKCVAAFRDALGMPVIDVSEETVESLGARLAFCVPEAGSNIELMAPADPAAPLSQSLEKFLTRRGEGLFALMLEAPDPDAEAEALSARGLRVLPLMQGAAGRDVHPSSTAGVLIRVYPVDSFDRGAPEEFDAAATPGLSGIARVLIAVHDLERATGIYRDGFGLEVAETRLDAERGVRSAICSPPAGGEIELLCAHDEARPFARALGESLKARPEGLYALVLQSPDPGESSRRPARARCPGARGPGRAVPRDRARDDLRSADLDRGPALT